MMMITYLSDTSSMMVQNITDNTPRILASTTGSGWEPVKVACSAYSGLVPMSPYTTPIAHSTRGGNFCFVCVLSIPNHSLWKNEAALYACVKWNAILGSLCNGYRRNAIY